MRLLAEKIAAAFYRREWTSEMLKTGEMVYANVRAERHIALAVRRGVDKGGGAAPIFVGSVGQEDFGKNFFGGSAVEQADAFVSERVGLWLIGEMENVGREKD